MVFHFSNIVVTGEGSSAVIDVDKDCVLEFFEERIANILRNASKSLDL